MMLNLNRFITTSNFILIRSKVWEKMKLISFALGQGQRKQHKMVVVNETHKHGRYEQIWVEQFVCPTLKFLPPKMAGGPQNGQYNSFYTSI